MGRKRDTALVPYKTCPHCEGSGQVTCTGREEFQRQAEVWAKSFHGQAVLIPFLNKDEEWIKVPGLAVQTINRGGWGGLKVYISVDKAPNWGGWRGDLILFGYEEEHDVVNGHKLYYINKGWGNREEVILLEEIPQELEGIKQIAQQERNC